MKIDAIVLSEKDNVSTALRDIRADEEVLQGKLYIICVCNDM